MAKRKQKVTPVERIQAWSASRLETWEQCPLRAKFKYIDKLEEGPKGAAMELGTVLHKSAEMYITGRSKELHKDLFKIKATLDELRAEYKKKRVRVEMEVALTKDWKPTQWFGDDVYVRIKIDALRMLPNGDVVVIDWKTGKFKNKRRIEKDDDALNLYATGALSLGIAKKATAKLVYTQANKEVTRPKGTLSLKVLQANQQAWDKRAAPMLADTVFPPSPSTECSWCPYTGNKGGPCEF